MAFERLVLREKHPRTEKLFHTDANLLETTARIVEVQENFVVLDRTVFYAESGGQEFDTGYIDDIPVVDVQDQGGHLLLSGKTRVFIPSIKIDTIVVHRLAKTIDFSVGQQVKLCVNSVRRRKLMRSHSAAHFLYHASKLVMSSDESPLIVKGCHITEDSFRFDFSGEINGQQAQDISGIANELMAKGGRMQMVQSEVSDEVFYWIWEDIIIPCGGTHVENVSELSTIKVTRSKKGTNVTRLKGAFV